MEKASKSKLDYAQDTLTFAELEAAVGFESKDNLRVRDAAEKAFLAITEATDGLMMAHGQYPDPGPDVHHQRRVYLDTIDRPDLRRDYNDFQNTLHGDCFYNGHCPTSEGFKKYLEGVRDYIRKVREMA